VGDVNVLNYKWTPNEFYDLLQNGEIRIYVTSPNAGTLTIYKVSLEMGIYAPLVKNGIESYSFSVIHSTLYMRDVYVDVDYNPRESLVKNHNVFYISDSSKVYLLNLTIDDSGNTPRYDTCFLMNDYESEVYILRYGEINVYFHTLPVNGLNVSAAPSPIYISDPNLLTKMETALNDYITTTSTIPGMSLAHISGNEVWDITVNGMVKLPLLSDIINRSEEPNSKFVGIYNITVHNDTKTFYHITWGLSYYPWLLVENNTLVCNVELQKYKDIDLGIESMNVITPEPYITGREIEIDVKVTNYGSEVAENTELLIYINGALYDRFAIGNIGGGASYEHTYAIPGMYFSTEGMYNISVVSYQMWDYNVSNNLSFVNIKVGDIAVRGWDVTNTIR
jgi:hypothetical protein